MDEIINWFKITATKKSLSFDAPYDVLIEGDVFPTYLRDSEVYLIKLMLGIDLESDPFISKPKDISKRTFARIAYYMHYNYLTDLEMVKLIKYFNDNNQPEIGKLLINETFGPKSKLSNKFEQEYLEYELKQKSMNDLEKLTIDTLVNEFTYGKVK